MTVPSALIAETIDLSAVLFGRGAKPRFSELAQEQDPIGETQRLLADAQSLVFGVATIERAYGVSAAQGDFDALITGMRKRWDTSVAGFEDALRIRAAAVCNIDGARGQMDALLRKSQGSVGAPQIAQAGNQLLALQSPQIADLTAAIPAQNPAKAQGRKNLS